MEFAAAVDMLRKNKITIRKLKQFLKLTVYNYYSPFV